MPAVNLPSAFAFPESGAADSIIATYFLQTGGDALQKAGALAIGQTTGTWTAVPGVTERMLARHTGRVIGLYEVPPAEIASHVPDGPRQYVARLAFPEANVGPQLPMLLTTLLGNEPSTGVRVKLLDVEVSAGYAAALGGPRFGVDGIRALAGVAERPLLLNVLKPCTGFTPEEGARRFAASARGGTDVIKDDEVLADTDFNPLIDRVRAYHRAALRVYEETGHRALYCANITDHGGKLLENGRRAVEAGADMVMVNALAAGLGSLQAVAADPDIDVPVLAHFAMLPALTEARHSGVASPLLLGKLMRLAGADAVSFPSPYSGYPALHTNVLRTAQFLTLPLHDLRPAMPVPGGGIHPGTAVALIAELGCDVMLTAGGAVQGHPGGAGAGAAAMRAALQAACDGVPLKDRAEHCPELHAALRAWAPELL